MNKAHRRNLFRGRSSLQVVAGLAAAIAVVLLLIFMLRNEQPAAAPSVNPVAEVSGEGMRENPPAPELPVATALPTNAEEENPPAESADAHADTPAVSVPESGFWWEGEVLSRETGSPVENARVMLLYDRYARGIPLNVAPAPDVEVRTGADGRFSLPLPQEALEASTLQLIAHADGYAGKTTSARKRDGDFRELPFQSFTLPPAGGMRGRVADETGAGVAGAVVGGVTLKRTLSSGGFAHDPDRVYDSAWAVSEGDGTFRLPGTTAGIEYYIEARAEGYTTGLSKPAAADAQDVVIVLDSGPAIVRGVVRQADGSPAAETNVSLSPEQDRDNDTEEEGYRKRLLRDSARTDEAGRFEITGLAAGDWEIYASRSVDGSLRNRESTRDSVTLSRGEEREVELTFPARVFLTGRVVDAVTEAPVPGALIAPIPFSYGTMQGPQRDDDAYKAAVTTGEDGGFRLEVSGSRRAVHYEPPAGWIDKGSMSPGTHRLPVPASEMTAPIEIELVRGNVLHGIVYQKDGKTPATEGSVTARPEQMRGGWTQQESQIGPDGRFTLSFEKDMKQIIQATSESGWAYAEIDGNPAEELVLVLEDYATVRGQVRTTEGEGVTGLTIAAWTKAPDMQLSSRYFAETDADGNYEHPRVFPGPGEMLVNNYSLDEGFVRPLPVPFNVKPGEILEGADFIVGGGDFVEGVVMDEDGEPIEDAGLSWYVSDARMSRGSTRTDDEGYFRIAGLSEGMVLVSLEVTAKGFIRERRQNVSPMTGALTITLRQTGGRVLAVSDERGRPVPRYEYALLNHRDTRNITGVSVREVNSADGRTELQDLSPGDRRVAVVELNDDGEPTGRTGARIFTVSGDEQDTEPVEVVLSDGTTIRGRVVEADTEVPVAGAIVKQLVRDRTGFRSNDETLPDHFRLEQVVTNSRGEFVITGVHPGTWYLTVNAEGMSAAPEGVEVEVTEGEQPPEVIIPVSPFGTIYGTIIGGDGAPAAGATIHWYPQSEWEQRSDLADENGKYRLENLPPDEYYIAAWDNEGRRRHKRDILVNGDEVEVNFDLGDMVKLNVSVLIDGQSWVHRPDAGVNFRPLSDGAIGMSRGSFGEETFELWQPPGAVRVYLTQGGRTRGYAETITIKPEPREQDVTIDIATASADYAVEPPEGAEMPEGTVVFVTPREDGKDDRMEYWGQEQRGHLPLIAAGRYKARFESRDDRYTGETDWQEVAPGEAAVFVIFLEEQNAEESPAP